MPSALSVVHFSDKRECQGMLMVLYFHSIFYEFDLVVEGLKVQSADDVTCHEECQV